MSQSELKIIPFFVFSSTSWPTLMCWRGVEVFTNLPKRQQIQMNNIFIPNDPLLYNMQQNNNFQQMYEQKLMRDREILDK